MIERIVENWLTSVSEREFEIPFCQLLSSKGFRIIHLTRHGPTEEGKDVIALAPDGTPCAYQLKSGNISLKDWRDAKGEIEELVQMKPRHPSIRCPEWHKAYLVTTGQLKEEVRLRVGHLNEDHRGRQAELETIVEGQLLRDFVEMHGRFLPSRLPDFNVFLRLLHASGRDMLPTKDVSHLLMAVLPLADRPPKKRADCRRALASALVLLSYVAASYQRQKNHIALIDIWTLVAAHCLALAERGSLQEAYWEDTFDLAIHAIDEAFACLIDELKDRKHLVEGLPLVDFLVYRARVTLLLGYLSGYSLMRKIQGQEQWRLPVLDQLLNTHQCDAKLLGEYAVPQFLLLANYLEWTGRSLDAGRLASNVLAAIIRSQANAGLPDAYHGMEECVKHAAQIDLIDEQFGNASYSIWTVVEWLARRLYRQTLRSAWKEISHIECNEFIPSDTYGTFIWDCGDNGQLVYGHPPETQSWRELTLSASDPAHDLLPQSLQKYPWFIPLLLLVYPHRLRPALYRRLDQALKEAPLVGTRKESAV